MKDVEQYISDETSIIDRCNLARDANTPVEVLEKLAEDRSHHVRRIVALNKNLPVEILVKLSEDADLTVRSNVAGHPNTPPEVLVKLSKDRASVMESVAANPNTPSSVLAELAKNPHWDFWGIIVRNPNIDIETLELIIKRPAHHLTVVKALQHPKITFEVCERLTGKVDEKLLKYKLHCLMLKDVFQSTYEFDYSGNLYLLENGHLKYIENIAGI